MILLLSHIYTYEIIVLLFQKKCHLTEQILFKYKNNFIGLIIADVKMYNMRYLIFNQQNSLRHDGNYSNITKMAAFIHYVNDHNR